jgi:hypothetical protein
VLRWSVLQRILFAFRGFGRVSPAKFAVALVSSLELQVYRRKGGNCKVEKLMVGDRKLKIG